MKNSTFNRYGYGWVTAGFLVLSIIGHWAFGWIVYVDEQQAHGQAVVPSSYMVQMARDTLENWQSEFLQLVWQVGGLAMLLWVGSPQSKEGDDRVEAKIDAILRAAAPQVAERILAEIDEEFGGRDTDSRRRRLQVDG